MLYIKGLNPGPMIFVNNLAIGQFYHLLGAVDAERREIGPREIGTRAGRRASYPLRLTRALAPVATRTSTVAVPGTTSGGRLRVAVGSFSAPIGR